jgi:hypothetical protein
MNMLNWYYIPLISFTLLNVTNTDAASLDKKNSSTQWIVQQPTKHDISTPLREIQITSETSLFSRPFKIIPLKHIPLINPSPQLTTTPHLEMDQPDGVLDIPVNTFQGIGVGLGAYQPRFAPPDANGAAGLTQYVQLVNADFAVFNKQTGQVMTGFPKPINALFSGFGGLCESTNNGDGIVKYDQLANRWIITQFAFADVLNGPFVQCIAVSTTSDATGAYYRYAYQFDSFNDFGKLGLWPDAYYMTFNMFGPINTGPRVCAFNRNAMLVGQTAGMQCKQLSFNEAGSLLPADLDGKKLPPVGNPEYILTLFSSDKTLKLYKFHIDFANPANTTLSSAVAITVPDYVPACPAKNGDECIPQLNSTTKLDTLSDRLMNRLAYRQLENYGAMVVTHTVAGSGVNTLRWYEIIFNNGTTNPLINRKGTLSLTNGNSGFIGSIAMDKLGNLALGYTSSSASIYPTMTLGARLVTEGRFNTIQSLIQSGGSQLDGLTRWGDYNNMAIDPVDDCTFWYTSEYLKTSGTFNWSTLIGNFKLTGC